MESNQQKSNRAGRKTRFHWSAVDTVILLLVLVALAGVVWRVVYTARQRGGQEEGTKYVVTFQIPDIHPDVLAEIRGFDAVYLYENDVRLGHLGVYEDTATGEYRVALDATPLDDEERPDYVMATGSMVCGEATLSGGGLLVGESGLYLTPGSEVEVRTDRVLFTLKVTEIRAHS